MLAAHWRLPGQEPQPEQEDDQHIQHDQSLPDVEVSPLENLHIPLADVKKADDTQKIQALDGQKANYQPLKTVEPRGGKSDESSK